MTPPFTCPICRRVSHNPNDARERFCAACGFVDDVLVPPNTLLRIDALYAFVSVDAAGNEGLCAAPMGGVTMPLIAADEVRLPTLIAIAQHLANRSGHTLRLIRLHQREELRVIEPVVSVTTPIGGADRAGQDS